MPHLLEHPFDYQLIMQKRKRLKRELLSSEYPFIDKKVAVLGGSTTKDIIEILELFLLIEGIKPVFYESNYGLYWESAVFDNEDLDCFKPDVVYIHTNNKNIQAFPDTDDTKNDVLTKAEKQITF